MAYYILSLDGGGSWALIQVRALIEIYGADAPGHEVLRGFDMVAANSGGGLVMAGLVEGLTLGELLHLFDDEAQRRAVFAPTQRILGPLLHRWLGVGARYSTAKKLPAIRQRMPTRGAKMMNEVTAGLLGPGGKPVHLLVVAFDYDANRAKLFRSAPTSGPGKEAGAAALDITLPQAIHASTNAPINYFDGPAMFTRRGARYWDGGLTGLNNPVLAAVAEAVTLDHQASDVRVLSLGTGTTQLPLGKRGDRPRALYAFRRRPSPVRDVQKAAATILADPPEFDTYVAHLMTGAQAGAPEAAGSRIVRMNPLISSRVPSGNGQDPPSLGLPGGLTPREFRALVKLDMDAVEQADVNRINAYCDLWLAGKALNQAIRADGEMLRTEVGHATFADAKRGWEALRAEAH